MASTYGFTDWRVDGTAITEDGLVTLDLVHPWTPSVSLVGDGIAVPEIPEPPALAGYVPGRGTLKRKPGGGVMISYEYKGYQPRLLGGGGSNDATALTVRWSVAGSFRQKDIRTHPNFARLQAVYGWDYEKEEFPPEYFAAVQSNQWKQASDANQMPSDKSLNPFYGRTNWDDLSVVITKRTVARVVTPALFATANRIYRVPWSALGTMDEQRDWRALAPNAEPHGDFWLATQPYLLSGPGGWDKIEYGEAVDI